MSKAVRYTICVLALVSAHVAPCLAADAPGARSPRAAGSGPSLAERIVAWVNNEPVALSEVEEALVRYQTDGLVPPGRMTEARLRQALERWIDETLMVAAARKAGVAPSPESVDKRVATTLRAIEERQGGQEEFDAMLARTGQDREKLREKLREALRRELIVFQAVHGRVTIADRDVTAFEEERRKEGLPTRYLRLAHAFLPLPTGTPEQRWREAEDEAHALRLEAQREGNFARAARRWARRHAAEGAQGCPLGQVSPAELQPELATALENLEEGTSTKPVRTSRGLHVLYLERRTSGREILFEKRYEKEKAEWIRELRRSATIQIAERILD